MTFADLKTKLADYLNRNDLSAVTGDLVNQAMHMLERGIFQRSDGLLMRHSFKCMKARTTTALTSGTHTITNPFPRYKELLNAHIVDSTGYRYPVLQRESLDDALAKYPNLTATTGRPLIITEIPGVEASLTPDITPTLSLLLRPTCDAAYTLDMTAYQYSPDLDGVTYTTNWWTQNAWEILLYGALIQAEAYLMNDPRIMMWQAFYDKAVAGLVMSEKKEEQGFSGLRIKTHTVGSGLNRANYNISGG